jgi:hypothetical protein
LANCKTTGVFQPSHCRGLLYDAIHGWMTGQMDGKLHFITTTPDNHLTTTPDDHAWQPRRPLHNVIMMPSMDGWRDGWIESFISSRPRLTTMPDDHTWRPRPCGSSAAPPQRGKRRQLATSIHCGWRDGRKGWRDGKSFISCVYLTVHITKLQLQTTFPKPLYIPHFTCIHGDPGCWKSWCLHCLWPVR